MSRLTNALFEADAVISRGARRVARGFGVARPLRIIPYRGYANHAQARVLARVVVDRGVPLHRDDASLARSGWTTARRFWTAEIADARVRMRWADVECETSTDDGGFVNATIPVPKNVAAGLHRVELEVLSPLEGDLALPTGRVPICVAGEHSRLGVISDIDDTVILTNVVNRLRRAKALFFPEASGRRPFEGVAEAYRLLHEGSGDDHNPFVYVSSSPWNIYDHLEGFLDRHDVPAGALLLRDWGLRRDGFAPDGRHGHKLDKVLTVLDDFPELPFILIGDSGQHDAEHYLEAVDRRPGRVQVIYIRRVLQRPGRDEQLAELGRAAASKNVELVVFDDSEGLLRDAKARGLL